MDNLNINYKKEVDILVEKYPVMHAMIRRTCTNTVIEAGSASAKNAQPQTVTAYVNCRLMPDESVDDLLPLFKSKIDQRFGDQPNDPKIEIGLDVDYRTSHAPASDINGVIPKALSKLSQEYFSGGIPVFPTMLAGATDLRFLRKIGIDAYGFGPIILSDSDKKRAHGIDERLYLKNRVLASKFFINVVLDVSAPNGGLNAPGLFSLPTMKHKKSFNFSNAFEHEGHGDSCQH
jgi:acetylornithine deacetylase/succinyl-diaminopimelate desuccinylase-like protein